MSSKCLSKYSKDLLFALALLALLISAVAGKAVIRKGGGGVGGGHAGGGGRTVGGGARGRGSSPSRPNPTFPLVVANSGHGRHHRSSSTRLNPYYPLFFLRSILLWDHISITRSDIGFALVMVVVVFLVFFWNQDEPSNSPRPTYSTLLMVQVELSGKASSLKEDYLNRISKTSDKSDVKGLHHILTETMSMLLEHHDYWNSGCSYVDKQISLEGSKKCFEQLSLEERKRVDIESLVNFNANELKKNSTVVKVLVATRGVHKLPAIKTPENLNKVLQSLSSISLDETMAVDVSWTSQDEDDRMSEEKVLLENSSS